MKKLISFILIELAISVHLLKLTSLPDVGLLVLITGVLLFFAFSLLAFQNNWKKDELPGDEMAFDPIDDFVDKIEPDNRNNYRVFETIMYIGFSLLAFGAVFKSQHWPGSNPIRYSGGFLVVVSAVLNLVLTNRQNCTYCKSLKVVSVAGLLFAGVVCTNYYWNAIQILRYSEYKHYVRVFKESQSGNSSYELLRECNVEQAKLWALEVDDYNRLDDKLTKANEMTEGDVNAKVIYILVNIVCDVYDSSISYDRIPLPINEYYAKNKDLFLKKDVKFYVVSNNPDEARKLLVEKSVEGKEVIIVE